MQEISEEELCDIIDYAENEAWRTYALTGKEDNKAKYFNERLKDRGYKIVKEAE